MDIRRPISFMMRCTSSSHKRLHQTPHGNEVVVIKVTMMSLKPGYKNPQSVSVWVKVKVCYLCHLLEICLIFTEHIGNNIKHPSAHWRWRSQSSCILYLTASLRYVVQKSHTLDWRFAVVFQRLGWTHSSGTWQWRHQCNLKQVLCAERKVKSTAVSGKQSLGTISRDRLWNI